MQRIKLFNKISEKGLSLLDKNVYETSDSFEEYEGALVRSAKLHDTVFPSTLKCIARAGAGVNNVPIAKLAEAGVVVFNTPGANANAVKELVICSLLMSSRRIVDGIAWAKTLKGQGDDITPQVEAGKSSYVGPEIEGKKLGVIGLGAIGVMVANAAAGLGMEVLGYDPYLSVDVAWKMGQGTKNAKDVKEIFATCDYITMHVPATADTRDMINAESIATMKDGVRIMNFSRGELVNDDAIVEALASGKVARYVTDFPNEKLLAAENVIPLPHLGASTPESEENCARMAAIQVSDYLENGNIKNSVNFPAVAMPRSTDYRICIINNNGANILGKAATILEEKGIAADGMVNRTRDNVSYSIIDVKTSPSDDVIAAISAIESVISVRVIG